MNQQSPDSIPRRQEQGYDRELATDAWLGADPAQRQAFAARLVQQWQHEAEQLVAQQHYQKALEVYARILVVNPEHAQARQGRAQAIARRG